MHVALCVKWPLKLFNLNDTWSSPSLPFVFPNTKFHEDLDVPKTLNAYRWTARVIFIRALEGCKHACSVFNVLLTVHLGIIFVNNQLDAQFLFMYVYFYSLHVSGNHVPIIRRINFINMTSGICHCV
jgi:hypothetical protein